VKYVDVTLQRWQVAYATEEAERRNAVALKNDLRTGTTATIGLDSASAHLIGAVCELATASYTGIDERFFDDNDLNLPDVGLIEVRGTKKLDGDLRVYKTDVEKAPIMVLAVIRHLEEAGAVIRLQGWADSEHAWNYAKPAPFPPHPKRGQARYHASSALRPMATLVRHHKMLEAW
jgi:hypothetical protein